MEGAVLCRTPHECEIAGRHKHDPVKFTFPVGVNDALQSLRTDSVRTAVSKWTTDKLSNSPAIVCSTAADIYLSQALEAVRNARQCARWAGTPLKSLDTVLAVLEEMADMNYEHTVVKMANLPEDSCISSARWMAKVLTKNRELRPEARAWPRAHAAAHLVATKAGTPVVEEDGYVTLPVFPEVTKADREYALATLTLCRDILSVAPNV